MRNRNCLPFASTWVNPCFIGGSKYTSFALAIYWSPAIDLLWLIFLLFVNLLHQDSYRTLGELYFILYWLFVCLLYALVSHDTTWNFRLLEIFCIIYTTVRWYWIMARKLSRKHLIIVWRFPKVWNFKWLHIRLLVYTFIGQEQVPVGTPVVCGIVRSVYNNLSRISVNIIPTNFVNWALCRNRLAPTNKSINHF